MILVKKRKVYQDTNHLQDFDVDMNNEFKIAAFDLMNYDQIYLATKMNYYQLNGLTISKLTKNLLFRNTLLNHEIEILYPNRETLLGSQFDRNSDELFDKCIENSIDYDFIVKILWQRIYIGRIDLNRFNVYIYILFINLYRANFNEIYKHEIF